jgi:hypothetical protein
MIGPGAALGLAAAALVAVVAYAAIVRSTGRTSARELAWTLIPALLLAILFFWTALSR